MKLPPPSILSTTLEMEQWVGIPPLHCQCCRWKVPPKHWGGIIKHKRGSTWFCAASSASGMKDRKGGGSNSLPFLRCFPCVLVTPSHPSWLPFPSTLLHLAPYSLISAPTSLKEGRGDHLSTVTWRLRLLASVTWRLGIVSGCDVA